MTYALTGALLVLLAVQQLLHYRQLKAERAHHDGREDTFFEQLRSVLARQDEVHRSHREEIAALNQARVEETANLLQRIQAPEQAVVSHVADSAGPDPAPANLENDQEMFELYRERLENMGMAVNG